MPKPCPTSRYDYSATPTAATQQRPISNPISTSIFSTGRQAAEIDDPSAAVFVAMADNLIIGYAHVVVRLADERSALLKRIYVDAGWRGRGLAGGLLDAVVGEAGKRGVTHLELTMFERNNRALAFYTRVGFAAIGSTTFMVGEDPQTDVVMQLDLAGRLNGELA
ncbi:GCN5-related N-acetyltransferase protein [Rhizobium phaseoli]|uniref:GNAT family N-acetyltransferase n=1 Tax=Rhizobium phaseoli TaxID=396 RepID=UPI0007F12728|nr:GNAT family N-acetyltransferase [Rhizobium phaseoli]ANL73623.1 GCN5-related N-acetyltransferase protein [Rhizobium phaseoli]